MYILDTNTLIYFFKGVGNVAKNLFSISPAEIGLPAIVLFELEVGIGKSVQPDKRKIQLQQFIDTVNLLPFARQEAICAAKIRLQLESKGNVIGPYDILIAATAISANGVLITHNMKEFKRVDGLQVEDWF